MAKVTSYPSTANRKTLAQSAVLVTARAGTQGLAPLIITWLDGPGTWLDAQAPWTEYPYAHWLDGPDLWTDAQQYWDQVASQTTTAYVRAARAIYNQPTGAYKQAAHDMKTASAAWALIGQQDRDSWSRAAQDYNAAAYHPVIDPRTGSPRFATQRSWTPFSMFAAEYRATHNPTPLTPDHPNRTGAPDMSELLTGNDYEQRMLATLGTTDGNLTIAMYQVSPNWSNNSLAASQLFDALKAQPTKRANCKLIIGTPQGGTNLATNNTLAAAALAATGWQVRTMPQYPVLHAKLWLIERGHLYAGSHNLSNRATTSNHEAGILTTSNSAVTTARIWLEGLWNAAI